MLQCLHAHHERHGAGAGIMNVTAQAPYRVSMALNSRASYSSCVSLRTGRVAIGSTRPVTAAPMHVGQVPQHAVGVASNQRDRNGNNEMSLNRITRERLLLGVAGR